MENEIQILAQFLERCAGDDAQGREIAQPDGAEAVKLQRFMAGECNEHERAEVCDLLRQHPAWLRWLAEQVKRTRRAAESATGVG